MNGKCEVLIIALLVGITLLSFSEIDDDRGAEILTDSLASKRKYYVDSILLAFKGKEALEADVIFKNIIIFKGSQKIKVNHLMGVMNYWGEALGVNCTHCHNTNDWSSDSKPAKKIARQMYWMRQKINNEILPKIEGLESPPAKVNCITCHNKNVHPLK